MGWTFCEYCEEKINVKSGVRTKCPSCGRTGCIDQRGNFSVDYDPMYDDHDDEWEDSIPEGCRACGGDYPNCADGSCPMFDD